MTSKGQVNHELVHNSEMAQSMDRESNINVVKDKSGRDLEQEHVPSVQTNYNINSRDRAQPLMATKTRQDIVVDLSRRVENEYRVPSLEVEIKIKGREAPRSTHILASKKDDENPPRRVRPHAAHMRKARHWHKNPHCAWITVEQTCRGFHADGCRRRILKLVGTTWKAIMYNTV